jgi:hypothetical protein
VDLTSAALTLCPYLSEKEPPMRKLLWILPVVFMNAVLLAAEPKAVAESTEKKPIAASSNKTDKIDAAGKTDKTDKTGKTDNADKADKKPWTIEATPAVTSVQPGQPLDIEVRVVNTSDAKATVFVRALLWYAKSDNANVLFPTWPKLAGRGPVITYNEVALAPKEAYTHKWTANLAKDTPVGDTTFRVGITLKFDKGQPEQTLWSEPVKIAVKTPADAKPKPEPTPEPKKP